MRILKPLQAIGVHSMDWHNLLNNQRLGHRPAKEEIGRTAFLRDHDKIIFSGAFRRLARKTQVHPLATNDHVHNRLTHSLEVSCVGRSLAIRVGEQLAREGYLPSDSSITDLGDIVQSACLAHDIGNPPFGHTGEKAIRAWFHDRGQRYLTPLTPEQRTDLTVFEGNAQGLRVLTSSEYRAYDGGMRLTYATLGAFLKYPWLSAYSLQENCPRPEKYSAFINEAEALHEICAANGMHLVEPERYARHPLAYLVEAADDFCYAIIDLEDGLEMGLVSWPAVQEVLSPVLPASAETDAIMQADLRVGRKAALLRGKIIGHFISSGVQAFLQHHGTLLAGQLQGDLISHCSPEVKQVVDNAKTMAKTQVFEHPRKVELEIGAFEVIGTLLDGLIEAAVSFANEDTHNFKHQRIIDLMGPKSFPPHLFTLPKEQRFYPAIMRAIDFLAGMTDDYATYLAKQFSGMAVARY